jgi:predicted ATP-dependent protease
MSDAPAPLDAQALRWHCDPAVFGAASTADIPPIEGVVGQDTAVEALRFGLQIDAPGQHLFVRGLVGTGRLTLVRNHLRTLETRRPQAPDRAYVHNFDAPDRPRLLTLERGRGRAFVEAMEKLVRVLREDLPRVLGDEDQQERRRAVGAEAQQQLEGLAAPLRERLKEEGLALLFQQNQDGPPRPMVVPLIDGEPAPPDRLQQLVEGGQVDPEELERLDQVAQAFRPDLTRFAGKVAALFTEHRQRLAENTRDRARRFLKEQVAPIAEAFPPARAHLARLVDDVVEHRLAPDEGDTSWLRLYAVNLLAHHADDETRPVIVDNAPSIQSLLGTIDPVVLPDGSAHAPHMALHAGTLVQADGGTLILDARDLASTPGAWKALTRTLRSGTVELTPGEGAPTTQRQPGLKPDPVPVDVKVVLLGEAGVYHALDSADPDFPHLFKVLVDFDSTLPRDTRGLGLLAGVLARIVRDEALPALSAQALAALAEHAARIAAQPDKLTARFGRIADITREAVWVARLDGEGPVGGEHVREAIRRTKARAGLPGRAFRDRVRQGILRVDTQGRVLGQINGLATTRAGQLTYGFPTRLTATVGPGSQGAVNIEGEARLSGAIHTKAFHIVGGCLRTLLPTRHPLAFDASVAFEQSYGGIDGDSASGAQVCALLSALSGLPLDQGIAMTGAVDQKGNILPVGAVNEKIEGFFDLCVALGLTGGQGCILPRANVGDLMLRSDVVEACEAGHFHVWAVDHVTEAVALLTGRASGWAGEGEDYPEGTVLDEALDAARRLWREAQAPRNP